MRKKNEATESTTILPGVSEEVIEKVTIDTLEGQAKNMKRANVKKLVAMAMMVALHIILARVLSINAWNIRIGFSFLPLVIMAVFYGPLEAAIVGAFGDILGILLVATGTPFLGFTLTEALFGFVFGIFLHKKITLPRIAIASLINEIALSLFLNTYWISLLYKKGYLVTIPGRVVQTIVNIIVDIAVIWVLYAKTPLFKQMSRIQEQSK